MSKEHVVLAGGSGFLGESLAAHLTTRGYECFVLSRRERPQPGVRIVRWDGRTAGAWQRTLDGAAAVVNLTGRSVVCRYTAANRREINESRVDSVNALARAMGECRRPPRAWIQAGSLAIYGDAGDRCCDETTEPGEGFPVETCLLWEQAFARHATPDTRKVFLRIGFALGSDGGALETLARLAWWGLGGRVGSGRQYISWIHRRDLNRMAEQAIAQNDIEGTYNATGPTPVTNAEFMRELRRALGRPWSPPVPTWAVHVGCFLMRNEPVLALTGRRCLPRRFAEQGFAFDYPHLPDALRDVLTRRTKAEMAIT